MQSITEFTDIIDEMVAGHRIDDAAGIALVDDGGRPSSRTNGGFNRDFAEQYWLDFEQKPSAAARHLLMFCLKLGHRFGQL